MKSKACCSQRAPLLPLVLDPQKEGLEKLFMQGSGVDYSSYPIIVVNPDRDTSSWLKEVQQGYAFHIVSHIHECKRVLAAQKQVAAIVFDQVNGNNEFSTFMKGQVPQAEIFALLSPDQYDSFRDLIPCSTSCHPLFKPCHPEILCLEFAHSIERYIWKKERDLLLTVRKQENWFSLMGQLTREWSHEIRNRAAIISLNAEISMTKVRKQASKHSNAAETMEKIIEQCLKISHTLDSVRGLTNLGQNRLSADSLMEIIDQAIFLVKSELPGILVHIEKNAATDLSLSLGESTRLRSGLVNILRCCNLTEDSSTVIVVEDNHGFRLKIRIEDAEKLPFDFRYVEGPLQDLLDAEPQMLDLCIGIRLLKSLGGEVCLEEADADYHRGMALVVNLPTDFRQRPLYSE
ncbi:MAG: hypothetical protein AB1847_04285 [bacterium]